MSDLFRTGQAKRTSGGFSVSAAGGADIVKRLRKLENGGKVAIQKTVSDFATRAPAWVSKGIREHYGVDTAAINEATSKPRRGQSSIKVAGVTVDSVSLEYKGRSLTLQHFKMSPKQRPPGQQNKYIRIPGGGIGTGSPVAMMKPPKKYTVKATIIKGQRSNLPAGTFITAGNGGSVLPFQRMGEGRGPLKVVRTLSVPQMIEGRAKGTIEQTINEKLNQRFEHYINQAMK